MIRLKGLWQDTVLFDRVQDDFTFAVASDGTLTVTDTAPTLGTDVISGVETLRFNDGDLTVTAAWDGDVTLTARMVSMML